MASTTSSLKTKFSLLKFQVGIAEKFSNIMHTQNSTKNRYRFNYVLKITLIGNVKYTQESEFSCNKHHVINFILMTPIRTSLFTQIESPSFM